MWFRDLAIKTNRKEKNEIYIIGSSHVIDTFKQKNDEDFVVV